MALLPQQPGAPPIMVPIVPSTGAHFINQQQQIRLAVAHAQAAAAAQQSTRVSFIYTYVTVAYGGNNPYFASSALHNFCVLFSFVFYSFSPLRYHLT